jgi:hypothetical protein
MPEFMAWGCYSKTAKYAKTAQMRRFFWAASCVLLVLLAKRYVDI